MPSAPPQGPPALPPFASRAVRVDCHAHVYDLKNHPFDTSSGFDTMPCEVGTADQLACIHDAHGFTHGLLINPLGGYGTDKPW